MRRRGDAHHSARPSGAEKAALRRHSRTWQQQTGICAALTVSRARHHESGPPKASSLIE